MTRARFAAALALSVFAAGVTVASAQDRIYAAVFAHATYTVGARNPPTGLFAAAFGDTVWTPLAFTNLKAFDVASSPHGALALAAGNGVWRSTDSGRSWRLATGWRVTDALHVTSDAATGDTVLVGTSTGAFLSTDGGAHWRSFDRGLGSRFVTGVQLPPGSRSAVASTEDGVYTAVIPDGPWRRTGLSGRRVRTVLVSTSDTRTMLAGVENGGVYRSADGGTTWRRCSDATRSATIYAIAVDPRDRRVVYAGGYRTGLLQSDDGGETFRAPADVEERYTVHSIAVDPVLPGRLAAATLGHGVIVSDDGGAHWRQAGLATAQVWSVRFARR